MSCGPICFDPGDAPLVNQLWTAVIIFWISLHCDCLKAEAARMEMRAADYFFNYLAAIPCAPRGSPPSLSIEVRFPFLSTRNEATD